MIQMYDSNEDMYDVSDQMPDSNEDISDVSDQISDSNGDISDISDQMPVSGQKYNLYCAHYIKQDYIFKIGITRQNPSG
jgi:hypothetical protein